MTMSSRRNFLKVGACALVYGPAVLRARRLAALNQASKSLGLPLGVELYSIRDMLPDGYEKPLQQLAAMGYREAEAVGWAKFYNHSASQVNQAARNAGMRCVGAHYQYDQLHADVDRVIATNRDLGGSYIVCSSPIFKDPSLRNKKMSQSERNTMFTLEDWRWNAEQFNEIGGKVTAAGMTFAYHNHIMEFQKKDGVVPYDELMRLTDPAKVTMQMDCGWVVVGGGDPVALLRRYPTRISMLHVKDFKRTGAPLSVEKAPPLAQLGQGIIDYGPIFEEAAKAGYVKHCFVEQEASDIPIMEALKIDAEYMRKLDA
jgi:sugar phosphate isomerase/epimerase